MIEAVIGFIGIVAFAVFEAIWFTRCKQRFFEFYIEALKSDNKVWAEIRDFV